MVRRCRDVEIIVDTQAALGRVRSMLDVYDIVSRTRLSKGAALQDDTGGLTGKCCI